MNQFFELVLRNLRVYLRDKAAVFFSLLSMLIVIMLMVFFIGDTNTTALTELLSMLPGRDADADRENAELLGLVWTCAGIISINAVTVTLSSLTSMIKDRTSGKINSIYTAPMSRLTIAAGYIFASWLSSVIICCATLAITEAYCVFKGADIFTPMVHMKLIGMIAVNSFTYASLMYVVASLAGTEGAWSGLGTIIGTLVGFLGGIYMPIGSVDESIAAAMKCTPVIYGTVMFRKIMTADILEKTFDNAPEEMMTEYASVMGIELEVMENSMTITDCLIILALCGIVFLTAGVIITQFVRKSDR